MFNNNGYSLSDIAAATNGGYDRGGFGGFGGDGAWLLFFFIIILAGGWGNGFGYGNNGGGTTYIANDVQRGFDQSALVNGLNNVNNAVTNGFYTSQANLTNQLNTIGMSLQQCLKNTIGTCAA